jgi:hypothetical protein
MASLNSEHSAGYRPTPGYSQPPQGDPQHVPMTIAGRPAGQQPMPQPVGDTVVSQAFSGLLNVQKAQAAYNESVERNAAFLNQDGIRAALGAFADTPEARSVDDIERSVDQLVERKQGDVAQAIAALSPLGDTAEELRNGRVWDRTERKLAAATDAGSVTNAARQALEQATPAELGVLLQEIPSYLESVGAPTDWVHKVVAAKAPEVAKARCKLDAAKQARVLTHHGAKLVRDGIRNGHPPTQLHLLDPSKYDPDK